jgi:hypothetical protein
MLSLASATSHSEDDHLLIAHTLGRFQTVNPDITEMCGENLTAFGQSLPWNDEEQNTTRLQPAIRVAQKGLLDATTVSRSKSPIIGRIQIEEPEALDRALHLQRIPLDNVQNSLPGLLGTVRIQLNTVPNHLSTIGDCLERHAIANTRVERG